MPIEDILHDTGGRVSIGIGIGIYFLFMQRGAGKRTLN